MITEKVIIKANEVAPNVDIFNIQGVVLNVNLPGVFKRRERLSKDDRQTYNGVEIIHKNREVKPCFRRMSFTSDFIFDAITSPIGMNEKSWAKVSTKNKIDILMNSFNEGLGVSYDFVY